VGELFTVTVLRSARDFGLDAGTLLIAVILFFLWKANDAAHAAIGKNIDRVETSLKADIAGVKAEVVRLGEKLDIVKTDVDFLKGRQHERDQRLYDDADVENRPPER
jgi:hypothetical protein